MGRRLTFVLASRPPGCIPRIEPRLVKMNYELANYLLATLPPDEREQTVASLRRANAAEFRRMRAEALRNRLLNDEGASPNSS